jgi:hypothetical protein
VTLTDALLAHTADVTGLPLALLRSNAGPAEALEDVLDVARGHLDLAEIVARDDTSAAGALLDEVIQSLVDARHNLDPGHPVRRVLPRLRDGLALMDNGHRWVDQEWRHTEDPDAYVDQDGVRTSRWALPASLVVVEASAGRVA